MKPALVRVNDFGGAPVAEHNHPCGVCWWRSSVLDLPSGVFGPCWECQAGGWRMMQVPKWLDALLRWLA